MKHTQNTAFTLVELIVVVTILAILATIGFVSYSSYLIGVRDTNRIAQMTSLSDGLNLYSTTNDLPIPEDNVEVSVNDTLIAYQGYVGANILETINFDKGGLDPKDNTYFSYYLTRDRKYFQMMGFLEESAELTSSNQTKLPPQVRGIEGEFSLVNSANAVNFQDRIPTVTGKKLGILTDLDNTPVQDLGADINLGTTSNTYRAYLKNDNVLEGDNTVLSNLGVAAMFGGKINFAETGEIMFEATGDWNYVNESSQCIDKELFSDVKLNDIKKLFNAGYTNITIDTDLNFLYGGDDSTPRHFVYAKKLSDLSDYNMHNNIDAGNNTTLRLLETNREVITCTGGNRCGTDNRPVVNTNSEPLFIYRVKLQPNCDGASALNDLWSRNLFTFSGSYYRILMK